MRLYTKVVCLITLVVMGVGICSSLLVGQIMLGAMEGELEGKAVIVAQSLAESVTRDVVNHNRIPVRDTLHEIVRRTQDVDYAFIVGFDREIFAHSFEGGFPRALMHAVYEAPRMDALGEKRHRYLTSEGPLLDVPYPLVEGMAAHVHVGMNESQLERHLAAQRNRIFGLTLGTMLLAIGLAVAVSRRITRPLGELANAMQTFGGGKSGREIRFRGGGLEVADLTRSFNRMITQREQAEETLRESEARFRTIYENAPVLINAFDENGRCVLWNMQCRETFGWTIDEINAHDDALALFYPDPAVRDEVMQTVTTKPDGRFREWHPVTKDGKTLATMWANFRLPDGMAFNLGYDITERKRAERELQFRAMVLDSIWDGVTATDLDGRIMYVNRAELGLAGRSREELIGQSVEIYGEDPAAGSTQREIIETTRERGEWSGEIVNFTSEGDRVVFDCRTWLLRDDAGQPVGICGVSRDITDRKRAEQERELLIAELEAKNAELERFTYTVSHDLRSPLVTINGFLGMLRQDAVAGNAEALEEDVTFISNAARKMEQLLDKLLELSRIGRQVNPPVEIALADLAQEVVSMTSEKMAERGVRVEIAPDLPIVFGDHLRLWEVLQNLVDNAEKFMGDQPRPRIEIGCRRDGDEMVCFVRDNGMGIDPAYHEKVFGLFDRLDANGEGTGVGLAVVKRIVEVHGGRIWVESEGPGQGSTFCFTIPRKEETNDERD